MAASMEPRVFTLQEADKILPRITENFSKIFYLNGRIKTISKDMQGLMDIWDEQILEHDNPDNKFYFEKLKNREETIQELQITVDKINSSGCIIKDINEGLIDFYCHQGEDLILLCWKYGEEKIKYWHSLEGGFTGRRPIEELIQISERQV